MKSLLLFFGIFNFLKIIPPLTAKEVDRPPEEGDTLRNKIVRLMQAVTNVNYLASELLFILCKRSGYFSIFLKDYNHKSLAIMLIQFLLDLLGFAPITKMLLMLYYCHYFLQ